MKTGSKKPKNSIGCIFNAMFLDIVCMFLFWPHAEYGRVQPFPGTVYMLLTCFRGYSHNYLL